jgi:Transmembrane secretion effector
VSIPLAWWLSDLYLPHIYIIAVITGTAYVFYNIAEVAILPQLVEKEQLPRTTSTNSVVERAGSLSAPALGGFLVGIGCTTIVGAMFAYLVQGAMQLFSALSLRIIQRDLGVERATKATTLIDEIHSGVKWLYNKAEVRSLAIVAMALNFLFGPVTIAIIVMAKDSYGASPGAIGLLFSVAGVVALLVTLVALWFRQHIKVGHVVAGCIAAWALGMLAMPLSQSIYLLAIGWMIVTSVAGIYDVVATSYRLLIVPDELQARVNSVFRFVAFGIRPVTLALGGLLINSIGARDTLWILAFGMVMLTVWAGFGHLRKLA